MKISFILSQNTQNDITYLVRDVLFCLHLCARGTVSAVALATVCSRRTSCVNPCFQIMSRGQLLRHGRYKARGQLLISQMVTIEKEMLPSFRIVAYYHPSDTEVVADAVWVDIKDTCMGWVRDTPLM